MPAGDRERQSVRQRPDVPVGECRDREDEPRDPREPHAPASGGRRRPLGTRPALGLRPGRTGSWLRRLHERSMGTKAHRRARGRAFSEDEEAVQDVGAQIEGAVGGAERAAGAASRRFGIRGVLGHGNRCLRRIPLQRLRLRSGRPSGAAAVPDVRQHRLGEPASALRGLTRPPAGILPGGDRPARLGFF